MAARALKRRWEKGRELIFYDGRWVYCGGTEIRAADPTAAEIRAHPTARHPRYRLRVFDLCWPWRASFGEAMRDAVASRNAGLDGDLDACANIQRDPPLRGGIRVVGVLS